MEKIIAQYQKWLLQKNKKNTVASKIARLRRIADYYDILNEYAIDKCESVIDELTYTKQDQKCNSEPNTNIVIEGDYITGLASLKQALSEFVDYLNGIHYLIEKKKASSYFEGSFDSFKKYVGPKCRNEVNTFCKHERDSHKSICEYCGKKAELQSAHVTERPLIIKKILDENYQIAPDLYRVDLEEFFGLFKQAHMPINQNIFFLCEECHTNLDKHKTISIGDIRKKRGF